MVLVLEVQKNVLNSTVFYLFILMECFGCGKLIHDTMTKITKPVTNFIQTYLYQFFNDFYSLNSA